MWGNAEGRKTLVIDLYGYLYFRKILASRVRSTSYKKLEHRVIGNIFLLATPERVPWGVI